MTAVAWIPHYRDEFKMKCPVGLLDMLGRISYLLSIEYCTTTLDFFVKKSFISFSFRFGYNSFVTPGTNTG